MENDHLTKDISRCCGCLACKDACPQNAITKGTDRAGFVYPMIDTKKCVSCGICSGVCGYKKENNGTDPKKVYAAAAVNNEVLMNAASGGIFSVMAERFVRNGGVVCGAGMERVGKHFEVRHLFVENEKDIGKLAGSKYVQSSTEGVFEKSQEILNEGKKLLFSGTPCQIAALRSFLKTDHDNLVTVDIVCHGVPSLRLFNDHIDCYESKHQCTVMRFGFRDKSRGQGMNCRITEKKEGKIRDIVKNGKLNSYFGLYLQGYTYRENCYTCPYASPQRISDITIGDYWGIYQEHAKEIKKTGLDNRKGISCCLINTDKGYESWNKISGNLIYFESEFNKVAVHNDQLLKPSAKPPGRKSILETYVQNGYQAVDEIYAKKVRLKKPLYYLEFYMPKSVKRYIQKFWKPKD